MKANFNLRMMQSNERVDCTVLATQFAFNLSYKQAHELMASYGRKPRCKIRYASVAHRLGLEMRSDLSCKKLSSVLPALQRGRFVVRHLGHVFAVVDGVMYDTQVPKLGRSVRMVYQVPLNQPDVMARYPYLQNCERIHNTHNPIIPGKPHYD